MWFVTRVLSDSNEIQARLQSWVQSGRDLTKIVAIKLRSVEGKLVLLQQCGRQG